MSEGQNGARIDVKTFFLVPELSLLPEENLKTCFMRGFETYYLYDDPYHSLELKVRCLFSLFPNLILFINIDRSIQGIDWPVFIEKLQKTYQNDGIIGVTYLKRKNQKEIQDLERLYLFDIGVVGGCVPIEYQKSKNLPLMINLLLANQAYGQRKFIRTICETPCKVNLKFQGAPYFGKLQDISISHFSCTFIGLAPSLPINSKFQDIQISLKGSLCKVNALLCIKRSLKDDLIFVFVFINSKGKEGLDPEHLERVNDFIFNSHTEKMTARLKHRFEVEKN